jgi:hypothetical protein
MRNESLTGTWPRSYRTRLRRAESALQAFSDWLREFVPPSTDVPPDNLPRVARNLNRVEQEFLNVPGTRIEFPGWLGA